MNGRDTSKRWRLACFLANLGGVLSLASVLSSSIILAMVGPASESSSSPSVWNSTWLSYVAYTIVGLGHASGYVSYSIILVIHLHTGMVYDDLCSTVLEELDTSKRTFRKRKEYLKLEQFCFSSRIPYYVTNYSAPKSQRS